MSQLDPELEAMLRDLGRAVNDALAESPRFTRTLEKIRREGYRLHLLLDCTSEASALEPVVAGAGRVGCGDPSFQINVQDLAFLRSIGIDPTRRLRRRRSN